MVLGRAPASDFGASLHAVVVGVNSLPGNWLTQLLVAESDARELANALALPDGIAVPQSQLCVLTGGGASRCEVLRALGHALARVGSADSFVFYFAGHGLARDGSFFLCTGDASEEDLEATALSSTDLERLLASSPARGILMILDCCEGAAFAEMAPATFTRLRAGDYRLLISASRADQLSWEANDGSGTLFSRALLGVLRGQIRVGNVAGAVYFSDLVDAVDAYIAEGLERRPDHPIQEMMFIGAYVRDPLLFVHRGLSLAQVRFVTARYSPAYIRRVLARSAAALGAITLFALTVAYGLQDETQFARNENGKIFIYRGRPHYSLPGYPKMLWSLPYGPEHLDYPTENGVFLLTSPLGQPVMPLIEALMARDYRVAALFESGRDTEARRLALSIYRDSNAPFRERLDSALIFAKVAQATDRSLLTEWLTGERKELRLAAFLALMRLQGTADPALSQALAGEEIAENEDIVRQVEGPCTPILKSYLERRFLSRSNVPTNQEIIDAAVRTKCTLSVASLLQGASRPHLFGDHDIAYYAQHTGRDQELATGLIKLVETADPDHWDLDQLIGTMVELRTAPCSPVYAVGLNSHILEVRLVSIVAISRHCETARWSARFDDVARKIIFTAASDNRTLTLALDPSNVDQRSGIQYLIRLPDLGIPVAGLTDGIHQLLPLAEDSELRAELVTALIRYHDHRPLPLEMLDSNVLEVRNTVVEFRRAQGDPNLVPELLSRLGGEDDFYVSLAGRLPLQPADLDRLRPRLSGSDNERRQIACVLAMQDTPDHVIDLLTNSDWTIREEAADCTSFNDAAEIILTRLPHNVQGFPIEGVWALEDQIRRKQVLERELAVLPPDQRLWRLSILDKTPSGFGQYGRGMRYWIDEQFFRLTASSTSN
jgi:hypothetical protein